MIRLRFLAPVLAVLVVGTILASGCTGQQVPQQPPASILTIPPTRQAAPVPGTIAPALPGTTPIPVTPAVTPSWAPGTVSQGSGDVLIQGDVTGLKSARGNFIDTIQFTVVKVPGVNPVTFEIPNTQIIFTKFGEQFGTNYQIIGRHNDNGDNILDEGESFEINVPIETPYEIYPGQMFTMTIETPHIGVIVTATAPPVLTDQPMVLATAPG